MANKFKPIPPTSPGWYQVQWGDEEYNGYDTVEVVADLDDPTLLGWVMSDTEVRMIDPDDTQSRWRRVDPPKR